MNKKIFKEKQKLPKQKWYYMLYLLFERFKIRYKVDENLYKFSLPILETDLETENVNVELLREEVFQMYQLASKKRREKYRYNFKKDQFILSVTTFFWSFIFYLSIFFFMIFLILNFLKLENNLSLEEAYKYKFKDNINDLLFWYKDKFEEEEEAVEDLEEITRIGFFNEDKKNNLDFETILDKLGVSEYVKTVLFNFRDLPMLYIKEFLEVLGESWKLDDVNLILQFREMYLDYFLKNFKSQFFYLFPSFFSEYWKFKYLNMILKPKKAYLKQENSSFFDFFFLHKNMFSWLLYQTKVYWSLWNYYIRSILNTSLTNLEERKASYVKYYIRHLSWNLNWISLITKNKFYLQELFYKKFIFSFSLFLIKWCVLPVNNLSNLFINLNSYFFLQSYIGNKFLYYGFYIRNESIKNFFLSINNFFLSIIKFFFKFIKIDFPILDLKLKMLYKLSFLLDFLEFNLGSNLFGVTTMDNNTTDLFSNNVNTHNNDDSFNILLEKYKYLSLKDIFKKNQYKFTDFVKIIEIDQEAFDDYFFDFNLQEYETNIRNLQQLENTYFYKNKEKRLFLNNIAILDAIKKEYLHSDILFQRMHFTLTDELPIQFENTEEVENSFLGFTNPEICLMLEKSEKEENNIRQFLKKYYLHQGFNKHDKKWWTEDMDAYGHDLFYLVRKLINRKSFNLSSGLDKDYFYFASIDEGRVLRKIYLKLWRYRNFSISNSFLRTIIKKWIMYRNTFIKDSKFLKNKNKNFYFFPKRTTSNSYWVKIKTFFITKIDFFLLQFLPYRYYQFNHFIKSFVFPYYSYKREITMFDHFRFFGNFIIFNLVSLKFFIVCIFFIFIIFLSYYKLENYRTKMDWKVYPFYVRDLHKFNISEKRWLDEMDFYLTVKELKDKNKSNDNF